MGEEHRMVIPGDQERIPDVCDFVVAAARRANLNERAVYHCQMAVDEACTNIIEHGYGGMSPDGQIEIVCRDEGNCYTIRITDDSPPFNPLGRADPDPERPLAEREPGGWGIYFIKKMMDEASYTLVDGLNRLNIVKYKTPQTTNQPAAPHTDHEVTVGELADGILEVVPHGRLDSNSTPALQETLDAQLAAGHSRLVVNMSQVSYISSNGLKALVNSWRQARSKQGNIVLVGLTTHVREVFETVGFDQVFTIAGTVDEAVTQFTNQTA